jgi:hypothetical protein
MNVWVENRGCVATTAPATLNMYWSVARLWEPWGHDWHNFSQYQSFAQTNFVNWLDPITKTIKPQPLGNHITLTNKNDYTSIESPVSIPAGVSYTSKNITTYDNTGGYLASVQWNAPDASWYTSSSTIFRHNKSEPVICYLAEIKEPNKTNNGFYQYYSPNSNVHITDYALNNNNVATVNSYLASPDGMYKTATTPGKYRSNIGIIHITNPITTLPYMPIPISIVPDPEQPVFRNNGTIYVIFDDILWQKWRDAGMAGSGFEIVTEQVVKITNDDLVTFTGIELSENEKGMLGIQFEYDGERAPEIDFVYSLSVGAYIENPLIHIGSPTHFTTHVLHTPTVDTKNDDYNEGSSGVSNISTVDFVNMYPNPAIDKLNITFELKDDAEYVALEIYDLQLRLIKRIEQGKTKKGGKSYSIPTDDLATGNYLLKLNVDNTNQTFKFVK